MASRLETYTHGHHESVVAQHRKRTAAEAAGSLLPHLKPGMRLLDVGCGPGSITLGLAAAVAPGEVLAIDLSAEVLAEGRRLAIEKGVRNVRFERADIEDLARPDGAFDVVYAHQVLQHVREPVRTLQAMKRVLARGGLVAVRDSDYGTCTWSPPEARIGRWLERAGFEDLRLSGTTWTFPGYDSVEEWSISWAERTVASNLATKAVEYGIATRGELQSIAEGFRRWCREPEAFFSIGHVEALGRKP